MAQCSQCHHFVDYCSVGIVPLLSEAGGSSSNLIEIMRDTIDGIPLVAGMLKSFIDLITILFHVDGYTFMAG